MKNKYEIRGDKTIIFWKDIEIIIDTSDLEKVKMMPNTWYKRGNYVVGTQDRKHANDVGKTFLIHRLIMDCPKDKVVDHINRNPLDNRKENLRIVTLAENNQNISNERKNTVSKFRGVTWDKQKKMWKSFSNMVHDGKVRYKHVGYFENLEDAKVAVMEHRKNNMQYCLENTQNIDTNGALEKKKESMVTKGYRHNKTSGTRGVSWHKQTKKWRVSVMINGKIHYSFHNDLEDAKIKATELIKLKDTLK